MYIVRTYDAKWNAWFLIAPPGKKWRWSPVLENATSFGDHKSAKYHAINAPGKGKAEVIADERVGVWS